MSSATTVRLSKNPIAIVLCQLRFSGIMGMDQTYLPEIQARLRTLGFKVNASHAVAQITMTPAGPQQQILQHYEFQSVDRSESVVINQEFVTYQATKYTTFAAFMARLMAVVTEVNSVTKGLTIVKIGLRYIDAITPPQGESWKKYVQAGFAGVALSSMSPVLIHHVHQVVAQFPDGAAMIIRILANSKELPLPPDLAGTKLLLGNQRPVLDGVGAATIDMDHFCELNSIEFDPAEISKKLQSLKDTIQRVWEQQVVTPEALEIWK
jgi:uncharacterized protein (TIGR04255 family)